MAKFKLNWGWSILLVYTTFVMVFIFFFYKSFNEAASNDLVVEDYYQKELVYGEVIAKKKNADTMRVQVKILNDDKGISVVFPNYISDNDVTGTITLYKPDNKELDKKISFKLQQQQQNISKNELVSSGNWTIFLDWKVQNIPYYIEKKIYIK